MFKKFMLAALTAFSVQAHAAVLADSAGHTVYVFDKDQGSTSVCYDACERAWPVVTNMGFDSEHFGTSTRKDGVVQITFDGRPLYYYVGDENPGETNGDGIGGVWHVINQ